MPTLKKIFFSSKSSRDSPEKHDSSGSCRLTRQRKLRHVSDGRLGLSNQKRRSDDLPTPRPLPRPEFRRSFELGRKERTSKEDEDGRDERVDRKPLSSSFDGSSLSVQLVDKTANDPTTKSGKHPTYFRRGFPLNPDDESDSHNFRLNVPARSAPTSGLSSPLRSPQRFSSVNFLPSSSSGPQFLFRNGYTNTPNQSPRNSPRQNNGFGNNIHRNLHPLPLPPTSPRRTQSPSSPRQTQSPSSPRQAQSPSSPRQTQSPTSVETSEKAERSSAKSQWIKGKLIGRGTYGSVFEAVNSETGAMCAMKEVDIALDDPKSVECIKQLEQEIKILQHLEHKNIVRYYGCEVVGDNFCIYLEYVHPGSINKYVRDHFGAITESVVRNFTRHILSGLAYLHKLDTVHRDIKGANLLVDASGVIKLADFGLAKHLTLNAVDLSLKGSPHWMAPELLQAVMRKDSDHSQACAIDIWSLGCTVIEMFNGKPPWSECTGVQALFHVMNKSPLIPESLSSEGKDFLNWCFKRNPAERPTAARLLNHPFVRITKEKGFSSCPLDFSGMKLADSSCSPREQPHVHRSLPTSPRTQRPLPSNGGRFNRESPREAPQRSPCSTLETLPSISPPDFIRKKPVIHSFPTSPNNLRFATAYDYRYQNVNRKAKKGFSYSFQG